MGLAVGKAERLGRDGQGGAGVGRAVIGSPLEVVGGGGLVARVDAAAEQGRVGGDGAGSERKDLGRRGGGEGHVGAVDSAIGVGGAEADVVAGPGLEPGSGSGDGHVSAAGAGGRRAGNGDGEEGEDEVGGKSGTDVFLEGGIVEVEEVAVGDGHAVGVDGAVEDGADLSERRSGAGCGFGDGDERTEGVDFRGVGGEDGAGGGVDGDATGIGQLGGAEGRFDRRARGVEVGDLGALVDEHVVGEGIDGDCVGAGVDRRANWGVRAEIGSEVLGQRARGPVSGVDGAGESAAGTVPKMPEI